MKKNAIVFAIFLFLVNSIHAIRHVGNGGGDAEMKILDYFSNAQSWISYCALESVECIIGVRSTDFVEIRNPFNAKAIEEVKFVKPIDYVSRLEYSNSGAAQIVFTHDELYIDAKKPQSNNALTAIMFNSINEILGFKFKVTEAQIRIRPEIKKHSSFSIFQVKLQEGHDLFMAVGQDRIERAIPEKFSDLKRFVIISESKTGYFVKSLKSGTIYELIFSPSSSGYTVKVFVQTDF